MNIDPKDPTSVEIFPLSYELTCLLNSIPEAKNILLYLVTIVHTVNIHILNVDADYSSKDVITLKDFSKYFLKVC